MEITINQTKRGCYELSNKMNTVKVEYSQNMRYDTLDGRYHPGWGVYFNGEKQIFANKETAFNAAKRILRSHNAFDIEGFIKHLDNKDDELDSRYITTIRNIVEYGLRNECIVENQFVDWIVSIISNAEVYDVVLFMNEMWLKEDYLQIKANQYFVMKGWALASEIWPDEKGRVDCGYKKGLYRGYRINVRNSDGKTSWLPTDFIIDNQPLAEVFNDENHLKIYREENCTPTGIITFLGYYKHIPEGPGSPIAHFERID